MQQTDKKFLGFLFFMMLPWCAFSQNNSWPVEKTELHDNWQIQSSDKVNAGDETISTSNFKPQNWYAAKVPNSTLGTLVDDGVFKNVFFNRNLENIPKTIFDVPWWYRKTFNLQKVDPGQVYRLRFNGISYRADIWLNGKKIASADTIEGSPKTSCQFVACKLLF
jgi:exo-1,4-beta-D-glucosaminidase